MKINLDHGFVISSDGVGYTLYQVTGNRTDPKTNKPEEVRKWICYPATLSHAVKRYAEEVAMDYEGTLSGYIDRIEAIVKAATTTSKGVL